ncbi:GNAT family N-acetyltransferase [Microbacterium bovistercoris]|uniref:GNAT family N-acetyltransferase n=1 Tax=Microbacterium bovistercoris TaxID=2293570 RepID=A0A371NWC3_9MICO|nr:GNAT family N-acetyltransferase [Microbacterium bovistercoris]REJ06482.1 GNAT family N-acetyltransferase [Microbacterium bovistercoris]
MDPRADVTVDLAEAADAAVLTRLQIAFGDEFDSPEPPFEALLPRFRRFLADPAAFALLAKDAGEVVGYAVVALRPAIYNEGGRVATLDELYVRPSRRSRGIGALLLDRAVQESRARDAGEMHINVDSPDVDARRFYERHGFRNSLPGTDDPVLWYFAEWDAG